MTAQPKRSIFGPRGLDFPVRSMSTTLAAAIISFKRFGPPSFDNLPRKISKEEIGSCTQELCEAMDGLLRLLSNSGGEGTIAVAKERYDSILSRLAVMRPGQPRHLVEKDALFSRPLSEEQEVAAHSLAKLYQLLVQSSDEFMQLSWEFHAVDALVKKGWVPGDAARIVVFGRKPPEAPPPEPMEKSLVADYFANLMIHEKQLVMHVLGREGECTAKDLEDFLEMHHGERELRTKNFISSLWTKECWGFEMDDRGKEKNPVVILSELLDKFTNARKSLYSHCNLAEPMDDEKLQAVKRPELLTPNQIAFIAHYLGIEPDAVNEKHIKRFGKKISNLSSDEIRSCWKNGRTDLFTIAELMHKVRFVPAATCSQDEFVFLETIYGKSPTGLTSEELGKLHDAIVNKFAGYDEDKKRLYHPLLFKLFQSFGASLEPETLLHSARAQSEVATLLSFFGMAAEPARATITYKDGTSLPKLDKSGNPLPRNQDAFSSAKVFVPDVGHVRLDAVFDGVGGEEGGYIASNTAKNVFEICALAGWLTTPEDLRHFLVLADLAIIVRQMRKKKFDTPVQENAMASTAVITFQCADQLYGVHCGDSGYKVLREGQVVFSSTPHILENEPASSLLSPEILAKKRNDLTSVLGAQTPHMHINNQETSPDAFRLQKGDIVLVFSDGMVPLCDHELQIVIDKAGGDLNKARAMLMFMVEERKNKGPFHTLCGCCLIIGKNDDKTLIMRLIDDDWVDKTSVKRWDGEQWVDPDIF